MIYFYYTADSLLRKTVLVIERSFS
jgi:hypothetical protein